MSKRFALTAVVLLAMLYSLTEPVTAQQLRWGVKGSLTISAQPGPGLAEITGFSMKSDNKMGFSFGAFLGWDLTSRLRLQPEILFTRKGSKKTISSNLNPLISGKVTGSLDYLEIPVLLKLYLGKSTEPVGLYLGVGPYLAFLLRDEYLLKVGQEEIVYDSLDGVKQTDYGAVGTIGWDIQGPDLDFGFHYRVAVGLAESDIAVTPQLPTVTVRNITHAFSVDVFF